MRLLDAFDRGVSYAFRTVLPPLQRTSTHHGITPGKAQRTQRPRYAPKSGRNSGFAGSKPSGGNSKRSKKAGGGAKGGLKQPPKAKKPKKPTPLVIAQEPPVIPTDVPDLERAMMLLGQRAKGQDLKAKAQAQLRELIGAYPKAETAAVWKTLLKQVRADVLE